MDNDVFSTIVNDDSDFEETYLQNIPETKSELLRDEKASKSSSKKGIKIRLNGETFRRRAGDSRPRPRRGTNNPSSQRRGGSRRVGSQGLHHSTAVHEKFWPPKEFFDTVKADLTRMAENGQSFYRFTREWDRMHSCGSNTFTSMEGFIDTFGEETARKIYLFVISTNGTLRSLFNHHRRDWEEVWRRSRAAEQMSNYLY